MNTGQQRWFLCDCYQHALQVDMDMALTDGCLYLSTWRVGNSGDTWRDKLRDIWYILKHGHAHADEIVLDEDSVQGLITTLRDGLDSIREYKRQEEMRGE